jgi:cell division septation protein DedD
VKSITEHIELLLYEQDCVVVPGFGGFVTAFYPAELNSRTHVIRPPSRKVAFNPDLNSNDASLAHHIARSRGIAYYKANELIQQTVADWNQKLDNKEEVVVGKIGKIYLNQDAKPTLEAEKRSNYLADSFGLSELQLVPVKGRQITNIRQLSGVRGIKKVRKKSASQLKSFMAAVLAVLIISFVVGTFLVLPENFMSSNMTELNWNKSTEGEELEKQTEKAESESQAEAYPEDLESQTDIEEEVSGRVKEAIKLNYYIIGGAFSSRSNAENFHEKLRNQGYNSEILETDFGMYRVTYDFYPSEDQAEVKVEKLREGENPSAWILEVEV